MNKEQLMALGLTEEQADKVIKGFGTMIPKSRFDEVNQAKKDLEQQIADRDKDLADLKKQVEGSEKLKQKFTDLETKYKQEQADFKQKLKETQLTSALKLALKGKVHDADLVATLIDKEKIELGEDGNIAKGLDEQIKSLQEAKSFLFVEEKSETPTFKGFEPIDGKSSDQGKQGDDDNNNFGKQVAEFRKNANSLEEARNSYFE